MVMNELEALLTDAQSHGWSRASDISLDQLAVQARQSRLGLVRDRQSGPDISLLEPHTGTEAHERSLSATYGVGPQPLH